MKQKSSHVLLLALLNYLADFDGQIAEPALEILAELSQRSDAIPPLYADVFGLAPSATCSELVERILSLSQEQVAICSCAFQVFRSYEQLLRLDTTRMAPQQQAANASQLERVRLVVARTRSILAEAIGIGNHRSL